MTATAVFALVLLSSVALVRTLVPWSRFLYKSELWLWTPSTQVCAIPARESRENWNTNSRLVSVDPILVLYSSYK